LAVDQFSSELLDSIENVLWRRYNDRVVQDFVLRHLDPAPGDFYLKTDLFEEALGNDSLRRAIPLAFVGMDHSPKIVAAARQRSPRARLLQADVRRLPFADGALGGVVSTSTLDHFRDPKDLELALREIARVVRPGGKLILTLDNPLNPILALRGAIPHTLRLRVGVPPYYVGYTCAPKRLEHLLREAGFDLHQVNRAALPEGRRGPHGLCVAATQAGSHRRYVACLAGQSRDPATQPHPLAHGPLRCRRGDEIGDAPRTPDSLNTVLNRTLPSAAEIRLVPRSGQGRGEAAGGGGRGGPEVPLGGEAGVQSAAGEGLDDEW